MCPCPRVCVRVRGVWCGSHREGLTHAQGTPSVIRMSWNTVKSTTTKHTCGGPAFGRKTPGCPRCDELIAGAAPVTQVLELSGPWARSAKW